MMPYFNPKLIPPSGTEENEEKKTRQTGGDDKRHTNGHSFKLRVCGSLLDKRPLKCVLFVVSKEKKVIKTKR